MSENKSNELKLKHVRLGNSGLKVSELCLGAMTFTKSGEGAWGLPSANGSSSSFDILNRFQAANGNFIDTADVYGESELVLGEWLSKQRREDLVIATKVRGPMGSSSNDIGLSRKHIMAGVEESLKKLQTHYIDLYQVHHPDPETPIEETMTALNDLVRCGKVRYIGVSNFHPRQIVRAHAFADKYGYAKFISNQVQYSLLCRTTEWDLVPVSQEEKLGILPWSPLAGGWLTGKYSRDKPPTDGRVAWAEKVGWKATGYSTHNNEFTWNILDTVSAVAKETGASNAQVSLRWLMQKPAVAGVGAPIIGATSVKQLEDNLKASTFELSADQMKRLNEASAIETPYPYSWGLSRNRSV